ncbi:MAG: hypothetical protein AB7F19_03530 [Candidatus Babeliales bacterium]
MLRITLHLLTTTLYISQLFAQQNTESAWQQYTETKKAQAKLAATEELKTQLKQTAAAATPVEQAFRNQCLQQNCLACIKLKERIEARIKEVEELRCKAAVNGKKLRTILHDTELSHELKQELAEPFMQAAQEFFTKISRDIPACATYAYGIHLPPMESIEISLNECLGDSEIQNKLFYALIPESNIAVPTQEQLSCAKKIVILSNQRVEALPTGLQTKKLANSTYEVGGIVEHTILSEYTRGHDSTGKNVQTTDLRKVLVCTGEELLILQQLYRKQQQQIMQKLDDMIANLND